jgi:hypothetical protein
VDLRRFPGVIRTALHLELVDTVLVLTLRCRAVSLVLSPRLRSSRRSQCVREEGPKSSRASVSCRCLRDLPNHMSRPLCTDRVAC